MHVYVHLYMYIYMNYVHNHASTNIVFGLLFFRFHGFRKLIFFLFFSHLAL